MSGARPNNACIHANHLRLAAGFAGDGATVGLRRPRTVVGGSRYAVPYLKRPMWD